MAEARARKGKIMMRCDGDAWIVLMGGRVSYRATLATELSQPCCYLLTGSAIGKDVGLVWESGRESQESRTELEAG